MPASKLTPDVREHITDLMAKHLGALHDQLTQSYGEGADAAFVVALGSAIATTLASFSDDQDEVAEALNSALELLQQPWRLTSVS